MGIDGGDGDLPRSAQNKTGGCAGVAMGASVIPLFSTTPALSMGKVCPSVDPPMLR